MISYITNEYGLRDGDMAFMRHAFETVPAIDKVILYGSRASGLYKNGSDIDLALIGNVTKQDISKILQALESGSPALLSYDIIAYSSINNAALKRQVDINAKVIYSRNK